MKKRNFLKNLISKIGKIGKFITLALIGLIVVLAMTWLLLPHIFSLSTTSNYIFESEGNQIDSKKIFLVSFQPKSGTVHFQPISLDMKTELFLEKEMEERTVGQWLSWFSNSDDDIDRSRMFGWLLKNNIKQIVTYSEQELTKPADILPIIRSKIFSSKLNMKERKHMFEMFAFAKNAEFEQHESSKKINDLEFPVLDDGVCSVAIINTTDISGLAGEVGEIVEKMGIRIIRVDGNDFNLSQTQIIKANDDSCQSTATSISQVLMGSIKRGEDQEKTQLLSRYRADLVLLLGTDQSL